MSASLVFALSQQFHEVGSSIGIPIYCMGKLRHREDESFPQGYKTRGWQSRVFHAGSLGGEPGASGPWPNEGEMERKEQT